MNEEMNSPHARDVAYHVHPQTNLATHEKLGPHIIERGEGIYVYDSDGKRYIEGLSGLWCTALGFSEKRLAEAAFQQLCRLPNYHGFAHKATHPVIDLAEKLIGIAPSPMAKAFFTNSGSEANDTQVKLVWYYNNLLNRPEKKKIIAQGGAYHGLTVASGSLTALPYAHRFFDLPIANILHADCPHYYHFGKDGESEEDFASRLAENLERLILKEGPGTVAAFIAEPVLGAGGVITPPRTYFEKIQKLLRKYDILFIVDEVISGFGRTGNMFACETYELTPDLMSLAKGLSSGYVPIGAVLLSDDVYKVLIEGSKKVGTFGTGFTYSGHPVSAAVALETLKIYEERRIVEHVRHVASRFQARLREFSRHPLVGEARGVGLIGALELVQDKGARRNFDPDMKIGPLVMNNAAEYGVIVRALINDCIAFCPPLIITEAEVDDMFDRFEKALDLSARAIKETSG